MKVSLQPHGNKYRLYGLIDEDQAVYVERRARRDRLSPSQVVRQAIDLMMRTEPLPDPDPNLVENGAD